MYKWKEKDKNLILKNNYMLTRTISMFDYENLPETIPEDELEKMLQTSGYAFITEVEGDLYAFTGGFAGEPDVYGNHTQIIVNNPALNLNKTYDLKEDGVLMVNDDLMLGLEPLFNYYNSFLVENDITLLLDNVNNRMQTLISATDDGTIESAKEYLKTVYDGDLGVIGDNAIFEGLKVNNNQKMNTATTSLIEFQQYIKATLFNEVGLNANFNMKRERLTAGEVEMNSDNLYPLVDNMLHVREEKIEKLNEMFNKEVTVEFGSVWKKADLVNVDFNDLEKFEPSEKNIDLGNGVETGMKPLETEINEKETKLEIDETGEVVEVENMELELDLTDISENPEEDEEDEEGEEDDEDEL